MEFGFDFFALGLGGVQLAAVVFGLVEFAKTVTGLQGKWVNVLAVALGAAFTVLYQVFPTLAPNVQFWVNVVVNGLGGGLAAGGWYIFATGQVKKLRGVQDGSPDGLG